MYSGQYPPCHSIPAPSKAYTFHAYHAKKQPVSKALVHIILLDANFGDYQPTKPMTVPCVTSTAQT